MLSSFALFAALSVQIQAAPPPYPRIRLADYLPPIEAPARSFEESRDYVRRNGEDPLPITPPQVEITAGEDLSRTSLSVAFNWVWLGEGQDRRPVWFARLRAMDWEGAIERFADSRTCPGLEESLRQIDDLPSIEPRVPTLPEPRGPTDLIDFGGGYLHDNGYSIRLRGLFAGGRYSQRMEVSGGSDAPFAPVIAETLTRLKPCWTETSPPMR